MQQLQSTIRIHLDSCFRHLMNVSFWSASLSFWKYLGLLLTNASPCSPEHHVLLSRFYSLYSTARYCHQELGETKKRAAARELQSDLRSSAGQTDDANWKTMVLCNCCMRKYATVCRQICRINLKVDDMFTTWFHSQQVDKKFQRKTEQIFLRLHDVWGSATWNVSHQLSHFVCTVKK